MYSFSSLLSLLLFVNCEVPYKYLVSILFVELYIGYLGCCVMFLVFDNCVQSALQVFVQYSLLYLIYLYVFLYKKCSADYARIANI